MIIALLDLDRLKEASEALELAGKRLVELNAAEDTLAWHCATTAVMAEETKDFEKVRKTWSSCLEKYPTNLDVVSTAISFYDDQGEPKRGVEILRAGLAKDPASRELRVLLSARLRLLGDGAEAEAVLTEPTRSQDPAVAAAGWMESDLHREMHECGESAMHEAGSRAGEKVGPRTRSCCSRVRMSSCWPGARSRPRGCERPPLQSTVR
jgi:predicted Zn-dependent protease